MVSAAKLKADAVTLAETGWGFVCPYTTGCGDPGSTAGFTSTGWPTKKSALARLETHLAEHKGHPPVDLDEFRAAHGIGVRDDGTAYLLDQE